MPSAGVPASTEYPSTPTASGSAIEAKMARTAPARPRQRRRACALQFGVFRLERGEQGIPALGAIGAFAQQDRADETKTPATRTTRKPIGLWRERPMKNRIKPRICTARNHQARNQPRETRAIGGQQQFLGAQRGFQIGQRGRALRLYRGEAEHWRSPAPPAARPARSGAGVNTSPGATNETCHLRGSTVIMPSWQSCATAACTARAGGPARQATS